MNDSCPAGFDGDGGHATKRKTCDGETVVRESVESRRDRVLVLRCLSGDEDAWEALVKSHSCLILNISWRFTGRRDLAEDLTQEIFLRAYKNLDRFRFEEAGFRTWLYRLSRNLLIDHHRKEKRYSMFSGSENLENLSISDDRVPGPQRLLEQAEAVRLLEEGLESLSFELRQAITLRELEGLSYRQIARIAHAPEGTIKSRVSRARLQLERLLARRRHCRTAQRRQLDGDHPLQPSYA